MNKQIQEMKDVAAGIVNGLLASAAKADVSFKRTIPFSAGKCNEMLVFGNVHPDFNDGYCIAVLNPKQALQEQLQPAVAYSPAILKELVAGHCEAMVQVQIVANRASVESSYHAHQR
ncbi:MAG: hypothetical protein IPF44_10580 [Betaproteobacteria bacterium]|nr:hypothetical protein [Betaproteobacteria bacterium]